MTVDNFPNPGSGRFDGCDEKRLVERAEGDFVMRNVQSDAPRAAFLDGCDEKRTPRESSCYFLPCILTAAIEAAAASGSR
jgi:hypothetical protein